MITELFSILLMTALWALVPQAVFEVDRLTQASGYHSQQGKVLGNVSRGLAAALVVYAVFQPWNQPDLTIVERMFLFAYSAFAIAGFALTTLGLIWLDNRRDRTGRGFF